MDGVHSKDQDRCESDDATRREESKKFAGIRRLTVANFLAKMPVLLSEEADGLSCTLKRRERLIDLCGRMFGAHGDTETAGALWNGRRPDCRGKHTVGQ
jgi:hypothetical protein